MNETETRRFLVTTPGLCATRWLSFVLASRPDVFVAHGKHSLDSVVHGRFDSERQQGDTTSLAHGNVMSDFYASRSLAEVFDAYRDTMPDAVAYGNVHSYTMNEVLNRFGPARNLEGIQMVNLIRHPIAYINSHTSMVRSAADHPPLRNHYRLMFAEALERQPELLDIPCQGGEDIEAFVVSCYSASRFLDDLRCDTAPHARMEDLTADVDQLTEFCEYLTRLPYDRQQLAAFINEGPINRHRKGGGRNTPHDVFGQWENWQRHVAAVLLSDELIERLESAKYDVSMLRDDDRPALARARSADAGCSRRLADFVDHPRPDASSDGWPDVPPVLVEAGYFGFNIVSYRGRHIGLAQSLGPVDLMQVDDAWLEAGRSSHKIVAGGTLIAVKQQINQLIIDSFV